MELAQVPKIKVNNTSAQLTVNDEDLEVPITGYEIRQPITRHTVYKIYVHYSEKQGWFVNRRYREFHRLRSDLKKLFPDKEITLPPKRYFGDNFEPRFLNQRRQGLQAFLYMITRQRDVQKSQLVATFLSLDKPPTVTDDIEQCRAVIAQLEVTVDKLKTEKSEHHTSLTSSNGQIVELHDQKQAVLAALRYERQQNGRKYYAGDDLSLMFEYRSLPEVCRVDVSSFLVRKPPAYLARKFEDKSRKFEDKSRKFEDKSRKEETKPLRDHDHKVATRSRPFTPPRSEHGRMDIQKEGAREGMRTSRPHLEIKPVASPEKKKSGSDSILLNGEMQSLYDLRRKSMPGAVEWHRVNNMLKAKNKMTDTAQRPTSLVVPVTGRPRSSSATEHRDMSPSSIGQPPGNHVRKQGSLESPKRNVGWSSLKDLRKMKDKGKY